MTSQTRESVDDDRSTDARQTKEADPVRSSSPRSRLPRVPLRLVLPNLVTLAALCAGLTALPMALEGRWDVAIGAVVFAAILDAIDGRVARLIKGTSRFGAELDSLADFVNFGVVPALLLYMWDLRDLNSLGWIVAMAFSIACALRLARFNVTALHANRPAWTVDFFQGMPAPAGALSALLPLNLTFAGFIDHPAPILVAAHVLIIAFLMVSPLSTFSAKRVGAHIRRDRLLPVFVALVLFVGVLIGFPFQVLSIGTVIYLGSIPVAWVAYVQKRREHGVEPK